VRLGGKSSVRTSCGKEPDLFEMHAVRLPVTKSVDAMNFLLRCIIKPSYSGTVISGVDRST
jgi:hypothetical protein